MKTVLLASLALAVMAVPAAAREEKPQASFTRNGVTYVYTSTRIGNRLLLNGRAYPVGTPFELTVEQRRVSGTWGNMPVSFPVAEAAALAPQLAAR